MNLSLEGNEAAGAVPSSVHLGQRHGKNTRVDGTRRLEEAQESNLEATMYSRLAIYG
jgi:hypothetical protein